VSPLLKLLVILLFCGVVEKPWNIGGEKFPHMLMQVIFRDYTLAIIRKALANKILFHRIIFLAKLKSGLH
jgi:hypothetical protein